MAIIGYIRVSSEKQTVSHQKHEIQKFAKNNNIDIQQWVEETISSRKHLTQRKLFKVLTNMKPGDILISCEISRLGRSILEIFKILENCLNKGCQIWTIKEKYRLGDDIQSKVIAFTFGVSAEIERNLISERTKASLENLKASGKKLGRPFSSKNKKLKLSDHANKIKQLLEQGVSKTKIAKEFKVERTTLRYFLKRENLN